MSMKQILSITLFGFMFLGCQQYGTYSERDYNAVKHGTNPVNIPSSKEYTNYSVQPNKVRPSYDKRF